VTADAARGPVLVIGLAATGRAVVRRLTAEGRDVVVVEERPGGDDYARARRDAEVRGALVVEAPGPDELTRLVERAALVVPSPGVRDNHLAVRVAHEAGVPIRSEVDLAGERSRVPIVGVTGTNGKTTVTTLVAAMLRASGVPAVPAGNIGRPLLDAVDDGVGVLVAELSSFQLRFSPTLAPRVAVLLNVADDHLDWHGGREAYEQSKANIFRNQTRHDLLVFNADDPRVVRLVAGAAARRAPFSMGFRKESFRVERDVLVDPDGRALVSTSEIAANAPHDRANALAAAAAALDVGATVDGVAAALRNFERLHHRVELVGKASGVTYYDDSKATNPHATLTAVSAFESVVLIAGGRNKGLDLTVLRTLAPRIRAVVAIGDAAPEVEDAFAGSANVVRARSMREAVRRASQLAQPGDAVLLSPACASFDWYRGYAERGDDFAREVATLIGHDAAEPVR
jgi:UDP-N-acetylmuramoylalanine--D-glutamate ligase